LIEMKLNTIVRFLNKELKISKIKDSSRNGLQVRAKNEIKKIGFAVDGCLSTFEKAKKANVDLLIVHHGIKWNKVRDGKLTKKRENFLKKNKISLYCAHLPLDAHPKYGNNIILSNILNLKNIKKFSVYNGSKIGYSGEFKKRATTNKIKNIMNKKLKSKSKAFKFGKNQIKTIGIVSGSGGNGYLDAIEKKLDCFLTGEIKLSRFHLTKESKLNVIVAGHYATETVGVKALMPLLKERFGVKTVFIENKVDL